MLPVLQPGGQADRHTNFTDKSNSNFKKTGACTVGLEILTSSHVLYEEGLISPINKCHSGESGLVHETIFVSSLIIIVKRIFK